MGASEFDQAILRTVAGVERKSAVLSADEKGVIARHEAGHAAVSTAVLRVLPRRASPVEKLSIVPRSGGALGCASRSCAYLRSRQLSTALPDWSHPGYFRRAVAACWSQTVDEKEMPTCKRVFLFKPCW